MPGLAARFDTPILKTLGEKELIEQEIFILDQRLFKDIEQAFTKL